MRKIGFVLLLMLCLSTTGCLKAFWGGFQRGASGETQTPNIEEQQEASQDENAQPPEASDASDGLAEDSGEIVGTATRDLASQVPFGLLILNVILGVAGKLGDKK